LDRRLHNFDLNGPNFSALFTVRQISPLNRFRVRQIGFNHCENDSLSLSFLNLFGRLIEFDSFLRIPGLPLSELQSLSGNFKVRHSESDRWLSMSSKSFKSRSHTYQLEFATVGDIFSAERNGTWSRVRAANGGFWGILENCLVVVLNPAAEIPVEFRFQSDLKQIFVNVRTSCLTVNRSWEVVLNDSRPPSPKQCFQIIASDSPARIPGAQKCQSLSGHFRVRHIATGKFLAEKSGEGVSLCFSEIGEVFQAEKEREWTRVLNRMGKVWFAVSMDEISQFQLREEEAKSATYCQFSFVDGRIIDRQGKRFLTVLENGEVRLQRERESDEKQTFEIIVGKGMEVDVLNRDATRKMPLEVVLDSFPMDGFV
jgi:hypothetical protein